MLRTGFSRILICLALLVSANAFAQVATSIVNVNFGLLRVGDYRAQSVRVWNPGESVIEDLRVINQAYDFNVYNYCPTRLLPHQECRVDIQFWARRPGYISGTAYIMSRGGTSYINMSANVVNQ